MKIINGRKVVVTGGEVGLDTTDFDALLDSDDQVVQDALETLDDHLHTAQNLEIDGVTPDSGTFTITAPSGDIVFPTLFSDVKDPTGYLDADEVSLSFDNGNRRLTVEPSGSSFSFYMNGIGFTKSSPETIDISDDEGLHFIYYDQDGILQETTTFTEDILRIYGYTAVIYWDATNSQQIYLGNETHLTIEGLEHLSRHFTLHTLLQSGGGLGDIVADQNGDDDEDAQFSIQATVIWDEDLKWELSARASTGTNIPVYYRSGADASNIWRVDESDVFPFLGDGVGGLAFFNELSGGTWSLAEVGNLDFVLAHVFAMNDPDRPYAVIMGQEEYTTLGNARDGALTEVKSLILNGLPFQEFKFLGTLIGQTGNGYDNTVKTRIRSTGTGDDYVDLRNSFVPIGNQSVVLTDHGNLTGLPDNDHPQYLLIIDASNLKSGANQGAAGAAANEIWIDTNDNTLKIGV